MKRLVIAAIMIISATALFAAMPATGVQNTFHDLSFGTGYSVRVSNTASAGVAANTLNQLCIWCHTPHHAIGSVTSEIAGEPIADQLIPLWNHDATDPTGFTMYNNTNNPLADLQGTVGTVSGISLACLSCHDGTVAMGAVRTAPYWAQTRNYAAGAAGFAPTHVNLTTGMMTTDAYGYVGTDLTNDHPISITYQDNLDTALKAPATFAANGVKLFGGTLPSSQTGDTVECGSCHNAHNYGTTGTTAPFLRYSIAGSALCLQCHTK